MDNLKQSIEVDLKVTPEQVAGLFCSMDADEQAAFFNEIYKDSRTWPACNLDLQIISIAKSSVITEGGRVVMRTIGYFSDEQ